MKRSVLAVLSVLVISTAGCASRPYYHAAYYDDPSVTAHVKTALLTDPAVRGSDMNVETYRGVVSLNGYVPNERVRVRAGDDARSVAGVRQVINNLVSKDAIPPAVGAASHVYTGAAEGSSYPYPVPYPYTYRRYVYPETDSRGGHLEELQWSSALPPMSRTYTVDIRDGVAFVNGTVRSDSERRQVDYEIGKMPGVRRVEDNLMVVP